jgi:hypothetical protein
MATRYVWSGATGAANGTSWTDAYTTLAAADAVDVAGDQILVAHDHNETASSSANVTYAFAGTNANPVHVVCVNRTTGAPANTAVVKTVGAYRFSIQGSDNGNTIQGLHIEAGNTATSNANIEFARTRKLRDCTLEIKSTANSSITNGWTGKSLWKNVWVKAAAAASIIVQDGFAGDFTWDGGGLLAGTASGILINSTISKNVTTLRNLDLSAMSTSTLVFNSVQEHMLGTIADCKLPAGWVESNLFNSTPAYNSRFSLYNCDAGNVNYNLRIADYAGTIVDETAIFRTDGVKLRSQANANIGFSLKSTTNANTKAWTTPLETDNIYRNYPGTSAEQAAFSAGTSKTVTVEIAHSAAAALDNSQIWLDVYCAGTAGSPLGVLATNKVESPATTPVVHTTSTEAWSGTAQTYRQKLQVTITPQMPGVITAKVGLATGNNVVVYIDPTITVT